MLMSGSWHIYRPGEKWQRPHSTCGSSSKRRRCSRSRSRSRWPSSTPPRSLVRREGFQTPRPCPSVARIRRRPCRSRTSPARADLELGLALLDQTALAGLGNVFKSEVAFACGLNPFRKVATLTPDQLGSLVATARKFLLTNVTETSGHRRTTGRTDREEFLWVYGRAGQPCRRVRHSHRIPQTHRRWANQFLVPALPVLDQASLAARFRCMIEQCLSIQSNWSPASRW